ncbi:DsbA family protein [Martelella lutilitoris]|uniref:DsbA family protein n=1 Tax=Martelella lutilitoris TaxID=2583532 RepID=A0A5C4JRX9_9HYPH|nr:DsbA family protein [Martelella lutilitoris]TNB47904.1 DsbA family protein [Martelella lutilitoris]
MSSKGLTLAIVAVVATAVASAAATTAAIYGFASPQPAEQAAASGTDDFGTRVHDYLVANPEILLDVQTALQRKQAEEQQKEAQAAIAANQNLIFQPEFDAVLGNPDGDITVVEFFDYNCGYCRRALADMDEIIADNDDVRFILKEIPVLGPESQAAQRVSYAFFKITPETYPDFHRALMGSGNRATDESARAVAAAFGVDSDQIDAAMEEFPPEAALEEHFALANAVGVTGTPAYIVGDTMLHGAIGADRIQQVIDNIRDCGQGTCS